MSKKNRQAKKITQPSTIVTSAPIKDFYTTKNQGVILLSGTTMQEIYKKTGPLADANEFQVHYWFLNFRLRAPDNSILDIAIPTCYFNYEQFVTGAHIDFELRDVKEMSAKVLPIHNMKANELINMGIKGKLEKMFNAKFEMMAMDFGSIHKHPGSSRSQSFSGTDYCKTAAEPGVVFPLAEASQDVPNFAGIMALDSKVNNVAHYEYRTVNGTLGTDIEYVEGRCAALTTFPEKEDTRSVIERLLNIGKESSLLWKLKRCTIDMPIIPAMETLAKSIYLDNSFAPSTDLVLEANVKKTPVATYTYGFNSYYKKEEYKEIPELGALQKMALPALNTHYKACCSKLGSPTPAYGMYKDILINDIVKAQNDIKELTTPKTEEQLEAMNIRELNTLYNQKQSDLNGVKSYRYVTNKETCIKDILEVQSKLTKAAKEAPSKEEKEGDTEHFTTAILTTKSKDDLVEIANLLNTKFFGDDDLECGASWATVPYSLHTAPSTSILIEEILQLQEWLSSEDEDEDPIVDVPSIEEIRKALESWNTDPEALATATDEQLRKWYGSVEIA